MSKGYRHKWTLRIYVGKHIPHRSRRQPGKVRRCGRNGHSWRYWDMTCAHCGTLWERRTKRPGSPPTLRIVHYGKRVV